MNINQMKEHNERLVLDIYADIKLMRLTDKQITALPIKDWIVWDKTYRQFLTTLNPTQIVSEKLKQCKLPNQYSNKVRVISQHYNQSGYPLNWNK